MENRGGTIKSFHDLKVYQNLYQAMILVHKDILPRLPAEERFGLKDQMRRASKAGPALIAEGFAKRYQIKNWQKYIDDTIGESNEMIHHLTVCQDIYPNYVEDKKCREIIDIYDISCRQLTNLKKTWINFHDRSDS